MIDHLSTYATDFDATKRFYDAVLKPLGYGLETEMQTTWDEDWPDRRICAYGPEKKPVFWVIEVKEAVSPRHVAFRSPDREAVHAFHAAGLAAGGTDHGEPGPRPMYHEHYYAAFLLDPDENNVEAVCHTPADA
jgi:catechol 2,3-dioxygenase-like lactoylglutathione lyase family enzyme